MKNLFRRWLQNKTQGDEEKELWWWKMFYRYEGSIGVVIAIILTLIIALIILPFTYFALGGMKAGFAIFSGVLWAPAVGGAIARIIVSPLYERIGDVRLKKDDVGQGSLLFATVLGKIANFLIHWYPLFLIGFCFIDFKWWLFIGISVFTVIYYMILGRVKPNAKDYVNWRFNWAIENYEELFSGHYKWWTAASSMSEQKYNLKKFQNYKYNAALALMMSPLLAPPTMALIYSNIDMNSTHSKNKVEQVQEQIDSVYTASDSAENIIEENNEEIDLLGSEGEDEIALQEESLNEDTHYDEYYEESSSQPTTSNPRAEKAESKPLKTESSSQPREHVNAAPADPVREEKPAASQAEQTPKANTGPEFQDGNYALTSYIARHINYPPVAAEKKIQGKVVVKLTISSTGQVSNAEIVQSVDPMLDAEALRLCKSLPRFTPARRNGQPVASTMTIPINFRL